MRRSNKAGISFTGFLRILLRRRKLGLHALGFLLPASIAIAFFCPLKYESEIILERKPAKYSPQPPREEFDIARFTSEIQRNVVLLKSRFLRERWLKAIGISYETPRQKERELKHLYNSLTVQPINYTDVFIVKVKAKSPEEARRRVTLLADLFTEWDTSQNREQAKELIELLRARMRQVNSELTDSWAQLKHYKRSLSLSLSGSNREKELETGIEVKNKLYDILSMELDSTERQLQGDSPKRSRILAPATLSDKPLYSRKQMVGVAVSATFLLALGIVLLAESQDPAIYRMGDIYRVISSHPIIILPRLRQGRSVSEEAAAYLQPLLDATLGLLHVKDSVVVQIVSAEDGDGKSFVCQSLAQVLSTEFRTCIIHRSLKHPMVPSAFRTNENGIGELSLNLALPIEKAIALPGDSHQLFIVETDAPSPDNVLGDFLVQGADITGVVLAAGRTSSYFLSGLEPRQDLHQQKFFFILNWFKEPLPTWLRR